MKKLIGIVAAAALLASAAFAELSISGGSLQLWSPVAYNGGDVMTGSQTPWGEGRSASVGFTWVSEDEKAGSTISFVYNPMAAGGEKFAPDGSKLIWVKPWDFLKLTLGHWDGINDIRLANTASENWYRPNLDLGNLYAENEHTGAMIELFPVEGLTVRVGLPFGDAETVHDGTFTSDVAYRMFEAIHAEVEYTITDLLGIKLAWIGGGDRHNTLSPVLASLPYKYDSSTFYNIGEIDALLQLLAVQGLQLDVGARINLLNAGKLKADDSAWEYMDDTGTAFVGGLASSIIGLKAGYAINDKFSVKADFGVRTYKKIGDYKQKPDFAFGVGVGVGLTDSLTLDADFRGLLKGDATYDGNKVSSSLYNTDPTFSFLVGLNYACSTNASVGIGFQGITNGAALGPLGSRSDNFGFAVPIRVDVHF